MVRLYPLRPSRPLLRPGLCAAAMLLAVAGARAQGQAVGDPPPGAADGGSFDGILRALDLKPRIVEPPAFVRDSRPAGPTDYIPVSRGHADRPVRTMTPEEVQAATAALDTARVAQQRRAGVKPPPVPLKQAKPAAAGAKSGLR